MSDAVESVTDEAVVVEESAAVAPEVEAEQVDEVEPEEDPNAGLKKALAAERAARKAAEKEAARVRQEIADKDKSPDEQALEAARREAAAEATQKANRRLARAELKASATGRVKNVALALKLIDLDGIDVDDDGEVDSESVDAAVSELLSEYPELSAEAAPRFAGGADQGAKGREAKPSQLSKQDLSNMTPEQIMRARQDGRLNGLLGVS